MKKTTSLIAIALLLTLNIGFAKGCMDSDSMDHNHKKHIKKLKKSGMSDAGLGVIEKEYGKLFNEQEMQKSEEELHKLHLEFQTLFLTDKVDAIKLKAVKEKINTNKKTQIDKKEQLILNLATSLNRKDREIFFDTLKMKCSNKNDKKNKK